MKHPAPTTETGPIQRDPDVRSIAVDTPFSWIALGWRDFRRIPALSLLYGVAVVAACYAATIVGWYNPWLITGFATTLLLIGPFLATGLYTASQQLENGQHPTIRGSLRAVARCATNLSLFTLFLALIAIAWIRLSTLIFALTFGLSSPSFSAMRSAILGAPDGLAVLAFYVALGFLLAAAVFVTSAVSIPLILDRDAGPVTAIRTSVRTVRENWQPMAVWAFIVTSLAILGMLTAWLALAVVFPLLGYATWHSYRDLVA